MNTSASSKTQSVEDETSRKHIATHILIAFLLFINTLPTAAIVRYVTPAGAGSKDGSSWENASDDPQAMINISGTGDSIWVAKGTYFPTHSANGWRDDAPTGVNTNLKDKDNSFVLKSGARVFGGFSGTETDFNERNWIVNRTILSGDFEENDEGNDSSHVNSSENAFHVVIMAKSAKGTVLDGFTIWGGNYYGGDIFSPVWNYVTVNEHIVYNQNGGGIYAYQSAALICNLEIRRNAAINGAGLCCIESDDFRGYNLYFFKNFASQGGGMYVNGSPKFKNIILGENESGVGGGVSITGTWGANPPTSNPHFINTLIHSNLGSPHNGYGAGMQIENAAPIITNSSIIGNFGGIHAGVFAYTNSYPVINNTIIWNNCAADWNGWYTNIREDNIGMFDSSCQFIYNNSLVQGMNLSASGGLDASASGFDPGFIYPPGYVWNGGAGSFLLKMDSPCMNAGNNELYMTACGDDFLGWDKELALTAPPFTSDAPQGFNDFFGTGYPSDNIYSGKEALRMGGDKINIGAFEATFTHAATLQLEDWTYGEPNEPKLINAPDNATIDYYYSSTLDTWLFEKKIKPTDAGNHYVQAEITSNDEYEPIRTAPAAFKINKIAFSASVSLSDWAYETAANQPTVDNNPGNGKVVYYYDTSASGSFSSTTKPTDAGTYYVKAYIQETKSHESFTTSPVKFTINKASFSASVSLNSWTYGDAANQPKVNRNPESGNVTYYYDTAASGSFTSTAQPTNAGTYYLKAKIDATKNYNECVTQTTAFVIIKALQSITFTPIQTLQLKDGNYTLTATSTSGLPVKFRTDKEELAEVSGNLLILKKPGNIKVTAYVEPDVNYENALEVTVTIALEGVVDIKMIKENSDTESFVVSPNPLSSGAVIRITLPANLSRTLQHETIEIYSSTGQLIQQLILPAEAKSLETTLHLPSGNFILRWRELERILIVK